MRSGMAAILAGAALFVSTGCTHIALERRTVKQASTLTDLQYQQVLDNLAMFACNPDAMAWHVKLTGGTVQIADQGSGGFIADIAAATGGEPTRLIPSASASRGILNQWNVEPAIGSDDLELLGLAYQKTVKPADKELEKEIRFAIWKLVATYGIAPGSEVYLDIMADAVTEESYRLETEMNKARTTRNQTEVNAAIDSVKSVFENLKQLVDKERLGEPYYKTPAEAKEMVSHAISATLCPSLQSAKKMLEAALDKTPEEEVFARPILRKVQLRIELIRHEKSLEMLAESIPNLNLFRAAVTERAEPCNPAGRLLQALCPDKGPGDPIIQFLTIAGHEKYMVSQLKPKTLPRNAGLVDQAEEKLAALKKLLQDEIFQGLWFCCGAKKDVPKCACYVGRYCACGRECYVWVMPEQMKNLKEFTLTVLTLAPTKEQDLGQGAAFSPSLR